MSNKIETKNHSAPGQMLGYLYQIDRALLWLSMCPPNSVVCIETDDDIVVKIKDGREINQIFEQDKSSIGKRNPFANRSKDLWKSIIIWLELIKNKNIDVSYSKFFLVTNTKVSKGCIAYQISKNNISISDQKEKEEKVLEQYKELIEIARNPNKKFADEAKSFLDYAQDEVISLLKQVELIDNDFPNYNRNEFIKKVAKNLRLQNYPFHNIYDSLYGWLSSKITEFWLNGNIASLDENLLHQKKDELVSAYHNKPFIEKTVDLLPIKESEIKEEENKLFVVQLSKINADDKEKLNAIRDFIRAKRERISYAENNRVLSRKDFENYEEDLIRYWEKTFKTNLRIFKSLGEVDCGYKTYQDTLEYRGNIKGTIPTQLYTSNGAYHNLANKLEIGWHPDWEKIFDKK